MVAKKICMVGAFAVGKSALLKRFVHSIFSDDYLSTVGVKISKKMVTVNNGNSLNLMLWDLEGRDDYGEVNLGYLRGANGFILVVDGTRGSTLQDALSLKAKALDFLGNVPHLMLINKDDLREQWEVKDEEINALINGGNRLFTTSAKTGNNVEQAFIELSEQILVAGNKI